ncbi:hypothetical protein X738_30310 [Mesorhizobium sp. LNHC209A00]|nr:hypothetical protein X738_30310 [Mesorhizobium sp. LNHC209A00]
MNNLEHHVEILEPIAALHAQGVLKQQARFAFNSTPSLAEQFQILAA